MPVEAQASKSEVPSSALYHTKALLGSLEHSYLSFSVLCHRKINMGKIFLPWDTACQIVTTSEAKGIINSSFIVSENKWDLFLGTARRM